MVQWHQISEETAVTYARSGRKHRCLQTCPKRELSHTLETTLSKERPGLYVTDAGTLIPASKQASSVAMPRKGQHPAEPWTRTALQSPAKCITGQDPAFHQLPSGKRRKSCEVGVLPRSIRPEAEHGEAAEVRTRHNQNSLTHRCGAGGAPRETTQQHRKPRRLIEHG